MYHLATWHVCHARLSPQHVPLQVHSLGHIVVGSLLGDNIVLLERVKSNLYVRGQLRLPRHMCSLCSFLLLPITNAANLLVKGYGVATIAQNKNFPAKHELLLSEITGLPLDALMQRNRLDVDERVEGSRQCSCSRP
jgi:hypothetical protein